ncbi:MAG: hypothetical protein AAFQ80_14145 [Cyanobacteria bacterium J06621_8]
MLKDASHQQVIQKFSFIESLNTSRHKRSQLQSREDQLLIGEEDPMPASSNLAVRTRTENQASAMVNFADAASTIDPEWYRGGEDPFALNWAEVINAAVDHQNLRSQPANRNYLGKILLALAGSYCLFVGWWVFGHQGSRILTRLSGGKQVVLSTSEVKFLDYLERSLVQIDRKLADQRESTYQDDVVYVPVYTPNPITPGLPQSARGNSLGTVSRSPVAPYPAAAPSALKIPAPPPLPAPVPLNGSSASGNQKIAAKPKIKHTLIGVLELAPKRSAALVRVKGQTRRIWVGETINAEGWILESVGNQRAIVTHHGQVRSITVGETF